MTKDKLIVPVTPPPERGRTEGYDLEPRDDMTSHGWVKELVWRNVELKEDGRCMETDFHYRAVDFSCDECQTSDFIWLVPQRTGIYRACLGCLKVNGPITVEGVFQVGTGKQIAPEVMYALLKARGVKRIPKQLIRMIRSRRGRFRQGTVGKDVKRV